MLDNLRNNQSGNFSAEAKRRTAFTMRTTKRTASLTSVLLGLLAVGTASAQLASPPRWTADVGALSGAASVGGGAVLLGAERQVYRLGADGTILWKVALGDIGRAFPVVRPDGSLLVAAYDDRVYALSTEGKVLWSVKLDGDVFASPALLPDGSAAVATAGGSLYRLSAEGKVLWQKRLGSPIFSSPAVSRGGRIYLGSQGGKVAAFDLDGQVLWQFQAGRSVFSSPALDAAGNLYFGSADRHLYSLTPAGQLRWKQPLAGFVNASPIVTAGGLVVVGSYGGDLNAYTLDGAPAWSYAAGASLAAAATELWNGDLLVGDLDGVLHRVSRSGASLSRSDLGERIDMPVTATDDGTWLVVVGGQLQAYAGGWPQAAGPWSSFRVTPQAVGHSLSESEQAAALLTRQAVAAPLELALAQASPTQPQTQPEPTPSSEPTPPTSPAAPVAEALAAPTSHLPRLIGGRVHLPLTELAVAYGLQLNLPASPEGSTRVSAELVGTALSAQADAQKAETAETAETAALPRWNVPAVLIGGVPYASIGDIGRQQGARVQTSADGLRVTWGTQVHDWALDWVQLYANPLPRP